MDLTPDKYHQALAYLTINSSFLGDLGLFHGIMGIVLFFAHYARVTQNKQYEDFAEILLDEIYEEIHWDLPINLENGLCGIGWGIEYLVQHGFMEGNTDEILADIDRKVLEIDPLRISDLSFRRGLTGIIFYVIARLNSYRETDKLPFDNSYLESIQQVLNHTANESTAIKFTKRVLCHVLKGNKIVLSISQLSLSTNLRFDNTFDKILLGLENGLTGWLWKNYNLVQDQYKLLSPKKQYIFLFDEESRSIKYGIGTYVNQLIDSLQDTEWRIIRIRTFSNTETTLQIKQETKAIYIDISGFKNRNHLKINAIDSYYRNIFFVLSPIFNSTNKAIFHLNGMLCNALALQLKQYFPKFPILLTVHYNSWSFDLLGNREKLESSLKSPQNNTDLEIYENFGKEKELMHSCDYIIAIARHSYENITSLYQVSPNKVILIPHCLADTYQHLSEKERIKKREKYGFTTDEILLIFAGRIDPIKGIKYLAETFIMLTTLYPKLRLIIAGDGNFNQLFTQLKPVWSKITCTGFIDKLTLYELFSISDIGIIPSLYEEFGFVALEMMMMGLPIIANNTTGLAEIVKHKKTGWLISVDKLDDISHAIQHIIKNINEYKQENRNLYNKKYRLTLFKKRMQEIYNKHYID